MKLVEKIPETVKLSLKDFEFLMRRMVRALLEYSIFSLFYSLSD